MVEIPIQKAKRIITEPENWLIDKNSPLENLILDRFVPKNPGFRLPTRDFEKTCW